MGLKGPSHRLPAKRTLYARKNPYSGALFPRFGNGLDGIAGIETDRFRPFHQFDDFDQFLSCLDITDVVLSAFETLGEINLA